MVMNKAHKMKKCNSLYLKRICLTVVRASKIKCLSEFNLRFIKANKIRMLYIIMLIQPKFK